MQAPRISPSERPAGSRRGSRNQQSQQSL